MMETVGIVDLGSNSVRLSVTRIQEDGGYRVIAEVKAVVRLSAEIGPDGAIGAAGLEHTLAVLRDFQRVGKAYGVGRYIAVATAAARQAKNGAEFIAAVTKETGIALQIIPGAEEGELGLTGALNTIAETDGLLIDIGGGSTELVRFSGRRLTAVVSLPYGAVNLTASFLPGGNGGKDAVERLERFLADVLMTVPWLPGARGLPLIGVGGSIRNVGRIDQKAVDYPLPLLHNYRLAPERVAKVYKELRSLSVKERRKVPGLSDDRAEIILPAVAMMQQVLLRSGAGEMVISGTGLREGLLYRHLLQDRESPVLDHVLSHSIANMVHIHGLDERLSREMSRVALALYDGLQPLHKLPDWGRRVLWAAAALAQAGSTVNVFG
ncbi:MAG: putative exopolyphosphatase, partial [Firmicutes bacterium]|nr:putative exopolyphosphatase [Bacillota bacterium]